MSETPDNLDDLPPVAGEGGAGGNDVASSLPPGDAGHVATVHIEDEMRSAYVDYAMSVIVGRALPDVRDGLTAASSGP